MDKFLFLALAFFVGTSTAAESGPFLVNCKVVSALIAVENLAEFERIPGVYKIDHEKLKLRSAAEYGWAHVIPAYDYGSVVSFDKPKGVELTDKSKGVVVSIYSIRYSDRKHLSTILAPAVYEIYKDRPRFSFLIDSLGVDAGENVFCGRNVAKSISMFLSSSILPLRGKKTQVYRLVDPEAILLVATPDRRVVQLIFPNPGDVDTLDYATITGPASHIREIVDALRKQSDN